MKPARVHLMTLVSLAALSCGGDEATTGADDTAPADETATQPDATAGDADGFETIGFDTAPPQDTATGQPPDAGGETVAGGFGSPCQGNLDCLDGYCVEGPEGFVCTSQCESTCPSGYDCRGVQSGSADTVFLCVPRVARVCVPCNADYQCPNGACLTLTGAGATSGQCSYACDAESDCPTGYGCVAAPGGTHPGTFCVPKSGGCDCTPELAGAVRTCADENAFGTCYGVETCDPAEGWVGCTAAVAVAEICDGRDNDCNALVDDGLASNQPCEVSVAGVGSCAGVEVCVGTQGMVCTARTPEVEVCDFQDNDCDGETDEDFKDETGAFTLGEHCGTCNNDCSEKIANGTGRCEVVDGASPVCVVAACDPDYVELNRFQCALPPDVSCLPCASGDECYDGSCITLDEQQVCVVPCGDSGSCQEGYSCQQVDGADRCVPVTGSCLCNPTTDGQVRTCVRASVSGTCYGQETCDAALGWVGCTARVPAEETCNGVDDDCSSGIDDVIGRGNACTNDNAQGSCPGVRDCVDGQSGLVCVGPFPSADVCNYEDDDCDGQTDEGFPNLYLSCSSGVGACQRFGFHECTPDGAATRCNATAGSPSAERCDRLDNDCDGDTDEDFATLGAVCSTGVGACEGFGTNVCNADGGGVTCSAVAGAASAESCDLVDNDCDGVIDNGFTDGAGRYVGDTTCGNCFTNCLQIFARPNATGACNTSPATPVCRMVCNAGYYDLNGVPDDGCEFFLDNTAIYVSESDSSAADNAGCGLGPSQTGGGRYPCDSIGYALSKAAAPGSGKSRINVASGAYYENVTLVDGISVYGGFSNVTWTRSPSTNLTAIFGVQSSGHRKTVVADAIVSQTTVFDGFAVYGQVANGTAENSYAMWIRNSNSRLRVSNNTFWPGTGGPGAVGGRGSDGGDGGPGNPGQMAKSTNGASCFAECSGSNPGGAGGTNSTCGSGTAGGAGANAPCPDFNESVNLCSSNNSAVSQSSNPSGAPGSGSGGGIGGTGGCDQLIDPFITECTCRPPGTIANCPLGEFSSDGQNGDDGDPGARGLRNASNQGEVANAEWRGFAGGAGAAGEHGSGGGGGGAGGGVESYFDDDTGRCSGSTYSDYGGSGGGGGAGGCGGTGGLGGGPGGGAFGIFVSSGGGDLPIIEDNDVHLGFGGPGGRGGEGGTAGNGGNGGLGGAAAPGTDAWCAQRGSKGGEGGDGGPGGGGAGGTGGVSFGIYASGGSSPSWASDNTFFDDGAGGAGGPGGGTGPGGNAGELGLTGAKGTTSF